MRDSVFSPVLDRLATFSSANEKFAEKFQRDPTLLPEQDVLADQEAIEEKYTAALFGTITRSCKVVAKDVDRVFDGKKTAIEREDELNSITWGLSPAIANVLKGLWVETWNLASTHATRELDILDGLVDGKFSKPRSDTAEFAVGDRERYFLAYPPDYGFPLGPSELRAAVDGRSLKLANDIDQKTADRMRETVRYFVENRTNPDGTMSLQARKDLVGQLGLAVGSGTRRNPLGGDYKLRSLEQIRDGVAAPNIPIEKRIGAQLPDDIKALQEDANAGLKKRLRTIARTELSAAYNTARLNVYQKSGKVKYVRWNAVSDERLCDYCAARVGTVHPLNELLAMGALLPDGRSKPGKTYNAMEYMLPLHPNDRCHWVPIKQDDPDPDRKPEARAATLASKTTMAVGGIAKDRAMQGVAAAAGSAATAVAKRITLSVAAAAQARSQELERQKQIRKVFLQGAVATGTAALGLALLYRAVGAGQPESTPQRVPIREPEPVPLWAALPSAIAQSAPDLIIDVDIRTVNTKFLQERGLRQAQIQAVTDRIQRVREEEVTPISRKLPPQLLSPAILQRFPKLRDISDLRNVTIKALVQQYGINTQAEAAKVLDFIRRDLQNRIPEIPDVRIRNTPLTKDTTWQELYQFMPIALRDKRGEAAAKAIEKYIKDSYAAGKPIRSLDDLKNVKGVGAQTIKYMKAQDFTQNPNQLAMGFYSDDAAAEILAAQVGLGPKFAKEIIQEARDGGQFSDIENLIDRIELRRRRKDGQMASLNFGDRQKKALREALGDKVFPTPGILIGQARSSLQQQRASLGSSSPYDQPPSPGVPLSGDRARELAALVDKADRANAQPKTSKTSSLPAGRYVPTPGKKTPSPTGQPSLASYDARVQAARKALDTYKGQKVYRQDKVFGKQETYSEAIARIDREITAKHQNFESTRQSLGSYAARLNDETEGILRKAAEAEDILRVGSDADIEKLINSLDIGEIELTPGRNIGELTDQSQAIIGESRSMLEQYRQINPVTAIDSSLAQSVRKLGDAELDAAADKLMAGLGLDEEALTEKVQSLENLVSRIGSVGGAGALQDIALARDRAVKARKTAADVRDRLRKKLADQSRLQVNTAEPTTREMKGVMSEVENARKRWSNVSQDLEWFRSSQRSPDLDSKQPNTDKLTFLGQNIDRSKRAERDADVALIKIRSYKGSPADVQYVTQEMVNQARNARSLTSEMEGYRQYLQLTKSMADVTPVVAKKADAFKLAFDQETQAISNGLRRIPKERELLTEIKPSSIQQVKALMEADLKARDTLAFWRSRGFTRVQNAAIDLERSLSQWEADYRRAATLIGSGGDLPSPGMAAISKVRSMLTETQSKLVRDYQPQIAEGLRLAQQQVDSVQAQLERLSPNAPSDSERYGMARRELLALEQKDTLSVEEQRRAAELDREVRDRGMAVYDRLLPESTQKTIANDKASLDTDLRRLANAEEELKTGVFRHDPTHQAALRNDIEYLKRSIAQWRGLINQARSVTTEDEEKLFSAHGLTASFSRRDQQQPPRHRGSCRNRAGVGIRHCPRGRSGY